MDENIEAVIAKLKEKNKEYLEKTKTYDELYEKYSKSLQVSYKSEPPYLKWGGAKALNLRLRRGQHKPTCV